MVEAAGGSEGTLLAEASSASPRYSRSMSESSNFCPPMVLGPLMYVMRYSSCVHADGWGQYSISLGTGGGMQTIRVTSFP